MQNELPSGISPEEIAEITQANREASDTESPEYIVASTMLKASALRIKEFSASYEERGIKFDPNIKVLYQVPVEDRSAVDMEICKGLLGISIMAMEKARKSGVLMDTDITNLYNEAFEETFMPKLSGKFTAYKLSKKEMKNMQDVTEKRDRTYGIYFTEEVDSLLPPIRELLEGDGSLDLIKLIVSDYQARVVKLIKLRAVEMEKDSMPQDH